MATMSAGSPRKFSDTGPAADPRILLRHGAPMVLSVMDCTERHREFIAHFAPKPSRLGVARIQPPRTPSSKVLKL